MSEAEAPAIASLEVWVAAVFAVIAVQLFALAYFKIERQRRERIEARTRDEIVERAIDALDSGAPFTLPPPRGWSGRATREAVTGLIATISGEGRERLVSALEQAGYINRVLRHLRSRNAVTRARGCMILGGMRSMQADAALTERFLNDPDANVRLTAAEALAEIGSAPTSVILLEAVRNSSHWQRLRIANAISRMGEIAVPALLDSLGRDADEPALRLSLDILSDIAAIPDIFPIVRLLQHPSPEIRGRAVGLLGVAGAVDVMAHIINRTSDAVWFVRVRAVKSMQRLGVPDSEEIADRYYAALKALLGDEAWWVRQHACEALASAGSRGREILERAGTSEAVSALQLYEMRAGAR